MHDAAVGHDLLQRDVQQSQRIAWNDAVFGKGGEDRVKRFAKLDGFLQGALTAPGRLTGDGEQPIRHARRINARLQAEKYQLVVVRETLNGVRVGRSLTVLAKLRARFPPLKSNCVLGCGCDIEFKASCFCLTVKMNLLVEARAATIVLTGKAVFIG